RLNQEKRSALRPGKTPATRSGIHPYRATPGLIRRLRTLDVQQQALRIPKCFFHGHQRQHGLATVNDAVVVGQGQVVHGADDDLAIFHYRALLRGVDTQDSRLRRVDDGGGQHRTEHTTVGNGERTAGELFERQFAVTGPRAEVSDGLFDVGNGHLVGIAQNRHHQAAWAAHSDTDIKVTVVDDVFAIDR